MSEQLDAKLKAFTKNKWAQINKLRVAEDKAERLVHRFNELTKLKDSELQTKLNNQRDSRGYLPQISREARSRRIPEKMSPEEFERLYSIEISKNLEETLMKSHGCDSDYDPLYSFQWTLADTIAEGKIDMEFAEFLGRVYDATHFSGHDVKVASFLTEEIEKGNIDGIRIFFDYLEKNVTTLYPDMMGRADAPYRKVGTGLVGLYVHKCLREKFEESMKQPN